MPISLLLIALVVVQDERKEDLLLTPYHKVTNSSNTANQLRLMVKLWSWLSVDEYTASLIDAYMNIHCEYCDIPDCTIKERSMVNRENSPEFKTAYRKRSREDFRTLICYYFKVALKDIATT